MAQRSRIRTPSAPIPLRLEPGGQAQAWEATARLAPRVSTWPYWAAATPVVTATAPAAAAVAGASTSGQVIMGAAALITAALGTASTWRTDQRRTLTDNLTEGLLPIVDARAARRALVSTSRWRGGVIGHPQRVVVSHAKALDGRNLDLLGAITALLHRELGIGYRVVKHDLRGKKIVFTALPSAPSGATDAPVSVEEQRIATLAADLLGASATIHITHDDTGQISEVTIHHHQGAAMSLASRRTRVERAMATKLPGGRWKAIWDLVDDVVTFRHRNEFPALIPFDPTTVTPLTDHETYTHFKIPYAVDEDGQQIYWHPKHHAHMVVIGPTGKGKTVALRTITTHLTRAEAEVWILDAKAVEFMGYTHWPNVSLIAGTVEAQIRLIYAAYELMLERYAARRERRQRPKDWTPLFIVMDEMAHFAEESEDFYREHKGKGMPTRSPVMGRLARLLRLARTAKIHIVIGLQRPDVRFIDGEARSNLGARLSMGRLDPAGAQMLWGTAHTGVATPVAPGRGTASNKDGVPVEVQTYFTPDPDPDGTDYDHEAVARMRPGRSRYPRLVVAPVVPEVDEDGQEQPVSFQDYVQAPIVPFEHNGASVPDPPAHRRPVIGDDEDESESACNEEQGIESAEPTDVPAAEDPPGMAGWSEPGTEPATVLEPGDLIKIPETEAWAVIELNTEDPLDDTQLLMDLRYFDSGEPETISVPADSLFNVRHPDLTNIDS